MKDIDFDELDRAVSSLLGSVDDDKDGEPRAEAPTKVESAPPNPAITQNNSVDVSPKTAQLLESAEVVSPSVAPAVVDTSTGFDTPASPPVRSDRPVAMKRRGGRFMDVVHPSSDMKSAPSLAPPSARAGRFTTVNPSRVMASTDPVKDDSAIDMAQILADSQPQEEVTPQVEATPQQSNSIDPLEFHGFSFEETVSDEGAVDESVENIEVSKVQEVTPKSSPISDDVAAIPPASPVAYSEPLSSPFLSDTKVDKRPLGAFSAQDDSAEDLLSERESVTPSGDASSQSLDTELVEMQRMAGEVSAQTLATEIEDTQTTADASVLPAELETELLSIESSESMASVTPSVTEVKVANAPESRPQANAQLRGGSIMQQYKEQQPVDIQQQTTAIYDVDTYERPLKHPKKKNSGWLVVTGIILLVLAGAAGGAYVYLYVL